MNATPAAPDTPNDEKVRFILRQASQIQDWEARAGRAFKRLRERDVGAAPVRAAYQRWLALGEEAFGPNCPIRTLTGYAVGALRASDDSEDACWLRKRNRFLTALVEVAIRAHHTYLDEILTTNRGDAFYQLEIDAEAFAMGEACDLDPAQAFACMDAAVRLYLARAGKSVTKRPPITDDALEQIFREAMTEATDGFAAHLSDELGAEVTPVRLGNHSME